MRTSTKFITMLVLAGMLFGSFAPLAEAQSGRLIPECNPVPKGGAQGAGGGGGETCGVKHIIQLLVNIYNLLLGLAAFVATFFIVFGAIRYFYWSFMEDQEGELKNAKLTLGRAITGLVIVACAYLIVNTVITWLGGGDINEIIKKGTEATK
jgi:hypothetical protein